MSASKRYSEFLEIKAALEDPLRIISKHPLYKSVEMWLFTIPLLVLQIINAIQPPLLANSHPDLSATLTTIVSSISGAWIGLIIGIEESFDQIFLSSEQTTFGEVFFPFYLFF